MTKPNAAPSELKAERDHVTIASPDLKPNAATSELNNARDYPTIGIASSNLKPNAAPMPNR